MSSLNPKISQYEAKRKVFDQTKEKSLVVIATNKKWIIPSLEQPLFKNGSVKISAFFLST
jgi:hypothetical protein